MEALNKTIAVIPGSTRPLRISRQVAECLMTMTSADFNSAVKMELLDLADWNLPMLDEPMVPAFGQYSHEHTFAWSRAISSCDGFVFVTPQYNWGYPAPLKNALDCLYAEWSAKPAVIVSYGFHGGGKAAAQLRQVLEGGLKMPVTSTMPEISLTREMYGDDGRLTDVHACLAPCTATLQIAFSELVALLRASSTDVGAVN